MFFTLVHVHCHMIFWLCLQLTLLAVNVLFIFVLPLQEWLRVLRKNFYHADFSPKFRRGLPLWMMLVSHDCVSFIWVVLWRAQFYLQMHIEQFVVENLNEHRKGLLGKTVSVAHMLSWTKVKFVAYKVFGPKMLNQLILLPKFHIVIFVLILAINKKIITQFRKR